MYRVLALFALAHALLLPSVADASGPSFDCAQASSEAEDLVCADATLAELDRRLADRFAAAVSAAGTLDAAAEASVDMLRAEQRGWLKGRDECWKADDLRTCVEAAYLQREAELVGRWWLEEPIAQTMYFCGGNYANEVAAIFFDTALPSVRIEYGDGIDVGTLVPTASGSRYEGTFGRSIWVKGESAMLIWSDGDEQNCEITE